MLSFKRFLYIVLIVAFFGGIFLIYSSNESRPAGVLVKSGNVSEREIIETKQIEEGDKPIVWLLGDPEDEQFGELYCNVRQLCRDIHLTVAGEGSLKADEAEGNLLIFCDAAVSCYAKPKELERFVSDGGRVILAAGLAEGEREASLLKTLGIGEFSPGADSVGWS